MNAETPTANALRQLFSEGRGLVGALCMAASTDNAEVMARAGFDWLLLDLQHGLMDRETLVNMLRALDITRTPSIVRVPWNRPELVGWVLDVGAPGVLAPMINNAADARALVDACRYAPTGCRSWGPVRTSLTQPGFAPQTGNQVMACALIETEEAIRNLDEILDVEGIDLALIGQSDLAIAHGLHPATGRLDPSHTSRLRRVIDACGKRGIPLAANCNGIADAGPLHALGIRHLVVNSDMGLLKSAAIDAARDVSALLAGA